MSKILVTGGSGQLGSVLKLLVQKIHLQNYLFPSHSELNIENENDVDKYIKDNNVSCIINCAAYTNVNGAEENEKEAYNLNAIAVKNLANSIKDVNGILIHVSTDYVYNDIYNTPLEPKDEFIFPQTMYGKTKYEGELFIKKSGCKYIIVRTSWLYSLLNENNFVMKMLQKMSTSEEIKVVEDQVGCPTNANDLAMQLIRYAENYKYNPEDVKLTTNYSNLGVASWYDFAVAIQMFASEYEDFKGSICKIIPFIEGKTAKVRRPKYSVMNNEINAFNRHWIISLKEEIDKFYNKN